MLDILRRRSHCTGSALFRGAIPHGLDQLGALAAHGVEVEAGRTKANAHWTATLRHPEWGQAEAVCLRDPPRPDKEILAFDRKLSETEIDAIADCGVSISLHMEGHRGFVLRDRKRMLRFLDAVMSSDGVAAVDHTSETFWTRPTLSDELAHDADLDVESIFTIHAVSDDDGEQVAWFHTHGLGELGRFDFDILWPAREFVGASSDFCRALAFSILEGYAKPGATDFEIGRPFPHLQLLPATDFMRQAAPRDVAARHDPSGEHVDQRVVLCDRPAGNFLSRLVKGTRPRPAGVFRGALPDNVILHFSTPATELMADRARKTFPVLKRIAEEVAELEMPILVKIGHVVDGGEPDQREHLWFQVHDFGSDTVDATLLNSPFGIERLHEGDRGTHSIEGLSDWSVLTPFGPINPHAFYARRLIREHREEMLRHLKEQAATD